jgi:hypothetical protein
MIERNLIPFSSVNIPDEFNIPRTSGKINKGKLNFTDFSAMTIHKSKSDDENSETIYIPVTFEDDITGENMIKHISLGSLLMKNPIITTLSINLPKIEKNVTEECFDYDLSDEVYDYYQKTYQDWIDNTIVPILDRVKETTYIDISVSIEN